MKGYFEDELVMEFRVGTALCGVGFTAVELDAADVVALGHPRGTWWLLNVLFPRLISKDLA